MPKGEWQYIGDGVYMREDEFGVLLHANHHLHPTDVIYLDNNVLQALFVLVGGKDAE